MGLSLGHIIVLVFIIVILFGAGKIPQVMGDIGKGLRNFKDGLKGDLPEDKVKQEVLPPNDKKGE